MLYHNGDVEGLESWEERSMDNIFGDWIFFGGSKNMGLGGVIHNYSIDEDLLNTINIRSLAYRHDLSEDAAQKIIADFADLIGEEDLSLVENYLTEDESFDHVDADIMWLRQKYQAELAKVFGYDCVGVSDEYGTSYMIDMTVHLKNLVRIDD